MLCSPGTGTSCSQHGFCTTSWLRFHPLCKDQPKKLVGDFDAQWSWGHMEANRERRREKAREERVEEEEEISRREREGGGGFWHFTHTWRKMIHLDPFLFPLGHRVSGRESPVLRSEGCHYEDGIMLFLEFYRWLCSSCILAPNWPPSHPNSHLTPLSLLFLVPSSRSVSLR